MVKKFSNVKEWNFVNEFFSAAWNSVVLNFDFGFKKLNFCGFYQSWIELFSLLLPIIRPANGSKMWFLIKIGGFYKKNCHKKDFRADNSPKKLEISKISKFWPNLNNYFWPKITKNMTFFVFCEFWWKYAKLLYVKPLSELI